MKKKHNRLRRPRRPERHPPHQNRTRRDVRAIPLACGVPGVLSAILLINIELVAMYALSYSPAAS